MGRLALPWSFRLAVTLNGSVAVTAMVLQGGIAGRAVRGHIAQFDDSAIVVQGPPGTLTPPLTSTLLWSFTTALT